jgi:RHS repeat-associated protein
VLYADVTFASTNQPWVNGNNTFTAIAHDAYGRWSTNAETVNLAMTNSYTYDLNGNLLYDGNRAFVYDDENQLIRVTVTNSWKSEYVYDGKMRRRVAKEFAWNGSSWTQTNEVHFIYDGNLVVQERNASNVPQVTYTRGNDLSGSLQGAGGIGGLLARTCNSQLLTADSFASAFYRADGNGNVTCLIYTNQSIAAKYLYDPYGNMLSQYGSLADANSYRFSSKEWNQNSGLYYYLYRLYDGNLQRWLNRDPINEFGFKSETRRNSFSSTREGESLYCFIQNSPLEFIDPDGLDCKGNCRNQFKKNLIGCALGVGLGFAAAVVPCAIACVASGPGYAFCIGFCIGYFASPAAQAFTACAAVASANEIACEANCPCQGAIP